MANSTETKKSGARFNIFDVIIIVALLACIAAVVVRAYFTANIKDDFSTAKIEFTVTGVSQYTASAFHADRKLYLASNDDEIGTVTSASYSSSKFYAEDATGNLVALSHPEKKDIYGTATLYGIWTDDGFMINGTILASAGKTIGIYTQDVECTLTILSSAPEETE